MLFDFSKSPLQNINNLKENKNFNTMSVPIQPKKNDDGSFTGKPFEDMKPFLDREEFEKVAEYIKTAEFQVFKFQGNKGGRRRRKTRRRKKKTKRRKKTRRRKRTKKRKRKKKKRRKTKRRRRK